MAILGSCLPPGATTGKRGGVPLKSCQSLSVAEKNCQRFGSLLDLTKHGSSVTSRQPLPVSCHSLRFIVGKQLIGFLFIAGLGFFLFAISQWYKSPERFRWFDKVPCQTALFSTNFRISAKGALRFFRRANFDYLSLHWAIYLSPTF